MFELILSLLPSSLSWVDNSKQVRIFKLQVYVNKIDLCIDEASVYVVVSTTPINILTKPCSIITTYGVKPVFPQELVARKSTSLNAEDRIGRLYCKHWIVLYFYFPSFVLFVFFGRWYLCPSLWLPGASQSLLVCSCPRLRCHHCVSVAK